MKYMHLIIALSILVIVSEGYYFLKKNHTKRSTIIILNGPSASGKSSIQEAFIRKSESPWIKIGIDNFFVGVLSNYYIFGEYKPAHTDDMIMQGISSRDEHNNPVYTLKVGPAGNKIINGMNHAIKAYADAGNNIIVDYIAYDPQWLEDLVKILADHTVLVIGVTLPLELLEKREAERATSPKGHARSHYNTVHAHTVVYDAIIDTSVINPQEAAESIYKRIKHAHKQ